MGGMPCLLLYPLRKLSVKFIYSLSKPSSVIHITAEPGSLHFVFISYKTAHKAILERCGVWDKAVCAGLSLRFVQANKKSKLGPVSLMLLTPSCVF
jgi:hypothetical protein